jgi:uncharacterized protein
MEKEFNLTEKERISYILQLSILEKLYPEDKTYKDIREALENGFTLHYKDLRKFICEGEDELSIENCKLVLDILDMYRGLIYSAQNNKWKDMKPVKFKGFDCNDELEVIMYSYAKYLMEDLNRFDEIKKISQGDYNSHEIMLPKYKNMISIWKKLPTEERYKMTDTQIKEILK